MGAERVLLVGCELTRGGSEWPLDASLAELGQRPGRPGLTVAGQERSACRGRTLQRISGPARPRTSRSLASSLRVDVVLFDDELAPNQQRNLENILGEEIKVLGPLGTDPGRVFRQRPIP